MPKKYKCSECGEEFNKHNWLTSHQYKHTGVKPYVCPTEGCDKRFLVPSKLKRHMKVHKGYPCTEENCSIVLPNWTEHRKHLKLCHPTIYRCHYCEKPFSRSNNLKAHMEVHKLNKKSFPCPKPNCSRYYATQHILDDHIRYYHDKRPFVCPVKHCNKAYKTQADLDVHHSRHFGRVRRKKKGSPKPSFASKVAGLAPKKWQTELISGDKMENNEEEISNGDTSEEETSLEQEMDASIEVKISNEKSNGDTSEEETSLEQEMDASIEKKKGSLKPSFASKVAGLAPKKWQTELISGDKMENNEEISNGDTSEEETSLEQEMDASIEVKTSNEKNYREISSEKPVVNSSIENNKKEISSEESVENSSIESNYTDFSSEEHVLNSSIENNYGEISFEEPEVNTYNQISEQTCQDLISSTENISAAYLESRMKTLRVVIRRDFVTESALKKLKDISVKEQEINTFDEEISSENTEVNPYNKEVHGEISFEEPEVNTSYQEMYEENNSDDEVNTLYQEMHEENNSDEEEVNTSYQEMHEENNSDEEEVNTPFQDLLIDNNPYNKKIRTYFQGRDEVNASYQEILEEVNNLYQEMLEEINLDDASYQEMYEETNSDEEEVNTSYEEMYEENSSDDEELNTPYQDLLIIENIPYNNKLRTYFQERYGVSTSYQEMLEENNLDEEEVNSSYQEMLEENNLDEEEVNSSYQEMHEENNSDDEEINSDDEEINSEDEEVSTSDEISGRACKDTISSTVAENISTAYMDSRIKMLRVVIYKDFVTESALKKLNCISVEKPGINASSGEICLEGPEVSTFDQEKYEKSSSEEADLNIADEEVHEEINSEKAEVNISNKVYGEISLEESEVNTSNKMSGLHCQNLIGSTIAENSSTAFMDSRIKILRVVIHKDFVTESALKKLNYSDQS